jgi:hypothetical protein
MLQQGLVLVPLCTSLLKATEAHIIMLLTDVPFSIQSGFWLLNIQIATWLYFNTPSQQNKFHDLVQILYQISTKSSTVISDRRE